MKLCYACLKNKEVLEKEKTSHFGERLICHACLGKKDIERMMKNKSIILYRDGEYLTNQIKTMSFKIKEETVSKNKETIFIFLFEKKRWQGKKYLNHNAIYCTKVTKQLTKENTNV